MEKYTFFKEIEQVPGYGVNRLGKVCNLKTGYILKTYITKSGYEALTLRNGINKHTYNVHRLVANTFIANPHPENNVLNHIDGNKLNNFYKNIEWTTVRDNTIHAYELKLSSLPVSIDVFDKQNNTKTSYRSVQFFSNSIDVDQKLLLGYMKYSYLYPFMGRYIITVHDEKSLLDNLNSVNFGTGIYIYDLIKNESLFFKSIGSATYYTGLRSMLKLKPDFLEKIGYCVSTTEFKNIPVTCFNKETLEINRNKYLSKSYNPLLLKIVIKDLLSNLGITILDSKKEFDKYMLEKHHLDTSNTRLTAIKLRNDKKTRLFFGYNIHLTNDETETIDWSKYSLEEIINSRNFNSRFLPVYEVTIPHVEPVYLFRFNKILNHIKSYIIDDAIFNTDLNKVTLKSIFAATGNNPNVVIKRLNKIMI